MSNKLKELMDEAAKSPWLEPRFREDPTKLVVLVNPSTWEVFTFEGKTLLFPDATSADNWVKHGGSIEIDFELTPMTVYKYLVDL